MRKKYEENTDEFQKVLRNELYAETFQSDEKEYSPEKIQSLVALLELENPTEEDEINLAQAMFEQQFLEKNKDYIRKTQRKKRWKRVAQTAAVIALVTVAANATTQAVMDKSLFHMTKYWADHIVITPGERESASYDQEQTEFEEGESLIFSTEEEFAKKCNGNFLIFSWLPKDFSLKEILVQNILLQQECVWIFETAENANSRIELWIYQKMDQENAVFTDKMSGESEQKTLRNGMVVSFCETEDGVLAGFESGDWWYLIRTSEEISIIEKMIENMETYQAKQ